MTYVVTYAMRPTVRLDLRELRELMTACRDDVEPGPHTRKTIRMSAVIPEAAR